MQRKSLRVLAGGFLLAALALVLSACGGGSSGSSLPSQIGAGTARSQFPPPTSPPSSAKKGGTLTVLFAGDVDYIDPGAAYYQVTYMIDFDIVRPLLNWPPGDTALPQPDLATSQPTITDSGKTVTFHIRSGIRYSPPLGGGKGWNKPVSSADVKYAIERTLMPGVPNGYQSIYFKDLVGYNQAVAAVKKDPTKAPNISGIVTPDPTTITFHLDVPHYVGFSQSLSLPASAPVPKGYAAKYDSQQPSSTYGLHQLDTGPYYVSSYKPGTSIILKRNPNWDPSTDFRPAYLNQINIQEGFTDTASASRKALTGSDTITGDFSPPPEAIKLAATKYKSQMTLTPSGGNRYVAFNTTKPPFNNINVRKAVIAASDRNALLATRGGPLTGTVATHFIPPGIPGFEQAGGYKGPSGKQFDFVKHPGGDMALATKYMKKAGFSSGKCSGAHCTITMVGDNVPPGSDTATVLKSQLEALGFSVQLNEVTHDTMYTKFCSVPSNAPNVCPNVGWIKDFNDGQAMIDIPFNGASINPSNNSNWPQLNNPAINKALDKAKVVTGASQRPATYGHIDDTILAQAPAIPWDWDNDVNMASKDVNMVINLFNAFPDLSFISLKNP
jgi:peptide/nickel transport system substrate-binding protein